DFDNLSEQATAISIEHTWQKSQRTLEDAKKALHTEIEARIREVKAGAIKLKLATRSRELAEKFVKIEQDKLKQGLTTNFKVIALQKNLKEAREVGLDAKFAYFNTLVSLDKSLGATLNTWGIEFKEQ
ncbi:TolC family protein, partial [bacterium]|nr:TolC family protein [bacterium]